MPIGVTYAIPALPVRGIAAAVIFYRDRLGFAPAHEEPGFAIVGRDAVELHLWEASDSRWEGRVEPVVSGAESFLAGTASCRIAVADIDAAFAEFAAAEVLHRTGLRGVVETPYGLREVPVLDLDGNLLTFFASA